MVHQSIDKEFIILENLYDSPEAGVSPRQRDLARVTGMSLGMTNVILKRLARKGWISVKKLNSRNIQYTLTLDGINEVIRRSYRYFKRTIRNVVFYKDAIDKALFAAKTGNRNAVLLIGHSDLDFIVEHVCRRYGMCFLEAAELPGGEVSKENTFRVYAEGIPEDRQQGNALYLARLLTHTPEEYGEQTGI